MANSTLCVLPSTIIPAPTSFFTSVAVCGETRFSHTFEPPVVTRPSMSTMSFTATGIPWNGPRRCPAAIASSAARAARNASSA
jgi:hypothetical protein